MLEIRTTQAFDRWLRRLRDRVAVHRINARLRRVAEGNLGDHHAIGEGVWELRFRPGPGYRIYYIHQNETIIILLCGADKDSQPSDIARAKDIATEWRREHA